MELTEEQRFEKAVQHVIVFTRYMQTSEKLAPEAALEVLHTAAERVAGPTPDDDGQGQLL